MEYVSYCINVYSCDMLNFKAIALNKGFHIVMLLSMQLENRPKSIKCNHSDTDFKGIVEKVLIQYKDNLHVSN